MWQHELCQDCNQQSWDRLCSRGRAGHSWRGQGGGGSLYLSPRMAYWLSSCKCCIEAPLVSSLPRFLCFTTSKVFSISRSLKQRWAPLQSNNSKASASSHLQGLLLGGTYLRVSTCLAVASRDGNCASLKISGGAWLCVRLVVVSRAPGGRYTPGGFESSTSTSSKAAKKKYITIKGKFI